MEEATGRLHTSGDRSPSHLILSTHESQESNQGLHQLLQFKVVSRGVGSEERAQEWEPGAWDARWDSTTHCFVTLG